MLFGRPAQAWLKPSVSTANPPGLQIVLAENSTCAKPAFA
jgi:hypothetical protein